jgi:hypothetical protein
MISVVRRVLALTVAAGVIACSIALDPGSLDEGCPKGTKPCTESFTCVPLDRTETGCAQDGCAPCAMPHAKSFRCVDGRCQLETCVDGFDDCSTTAISLGIRQNCDTNLNESAENCGGCGKNCNDADHLNRPLHARAACGNRNCYVQCELGWGDCGETDPMKGCPVDLLTDPGNCGKCGNLCVAGQNHMTGVCEQGSCVCEEGWADCDAFSTDQPHAPDGCEAELSVNPYQCGACGVVCEEPQTCVAGICTVP